MSIETAAMLVAMLGLIWQIYQGNKQSKLHFFTIFTQRYQDIIINLPVNIESDSFDFDNYNDDDEREHLLRWFRAYYDLCSEEFHLYKKGYVDKKLWKLWDEGIQNSLNKPAFIKSWELIQANNYYDREFCSYVECYHRKKQA